MKYSKSIYKIIFALIFLSLVASCQSVKVRKNERGVIFKKFGGGVDTSQVYLPGKYSISNNDRLIIYNIDLEHGDEEFRVLSKDNIEITVMLKYSFKLIPEEVALLHYYIGANYRESIVKREVHDGIKACVNNILSVEIPSIGNEIIGEQILSIAKKKIRKRYINLESVLIKDLIIP